MGEAIWRDLGRHGIAEIHPHFCPLDDPAARSSLFSFAQKNAYFPVWYSAARVVVTKNDSGDSTFNSSEFLGALFTSALQTSYYPRHDRNVGDTMSRFGGALSSNAIGNLLRGFTPDMKRLFRRHAPKKLRNIEEKLPIPPEDKP